MPITFKCVCGRELVAPDEYAGRQVRCGLCGTVRVVPQVSEPAPPRAPEAQPPSGAQAPPQYQPQGPEALPYQAAEPRLQMPPQMPPGGYQPPYQGPYAPYGMPGYGYQIPQAPPQYFRPIMPPPYQPSPYAIYRPPAVVRPENVGRAAAILSLALGAIGIGGHVLGCCMMYCWGVVAMLGCSLAAFIVGWISLSSAGAPDVQADARLGRALGLIGIVAAIIFIIFFQVPFFRQVMEMQSAMG